MVSFLFWHSIFMTTSTPLSRLFSKNWHGKMVHMTILNFLGVSQHFRGEPAQDTYLEYPASPKIDRAFLPHAVCGLLWILAAYLHVCCSHQLRNFISKRMLAYFACLAFVLHMVCSLRTLILDPMQHHVLPWTLLLSNVTVSTAYFLLGTWAASKRHVSAHKDAMIKCFLYSIEGAGTIRTVGSIMHFFGAGPTMCQQMNEGLAASCVFPYVQRLIGIRSLTTFYLGIYAQISQDAETRKAYKTLALKNVAMNISIILFFDVLDNPEEVLTMILSPFGHRSVGVLVAIAVGFCIVVYPDSPTLKAFVCKQGKERSVKSL